MVVFNQVGRGTYWRAFHIGRYLASRGHHVSLMATSPDRLSGMAIRQMEGITLIETPDLFSGSLRSGWDPWNVLNRLLWLRDKEFDLVHAFEGRPTAIYPALYIRKRLQIPLVMDWCDWFGRGGSVEERPSRLVRFILRPVETFFEEHFRTQADGTTVICSLLRDKALALGVNQATILSFPNGSDIKRLKPIPQAAARQQAGLPAQAFILGYLGRIFQRDAELMAKAFDQVHAHIPKARLLIAGDCPADFRGLVQDPSAVIQTGRLDDEQLNIYLASCDILWLPMSDSNANRGRLPLKLTDYLAIGRPVVATAVGDVPAIFQEGSIGLLSPAEPEAFAAATLRLYQGEQLREDMGRQARRLAEERFDWAILTSQLESYYQGLISQNRGHR